ncbi:MAG: transporter substrate-binding domain-containing protein [Actinomycetota bacterium]
MRRIVMGIVVAGLLVAACAEEDGSRPAAGGSSEEQKCDISDPPLTQDGVLTVATDRPAYPPWFEGSPKDYSGYEGEVAGEVARRMDLPIKWVVEPFPKSYAPGAKDYDFDINQITITEDREKAVDFSDGYFDNNQGVLALEDNPVADAESVGELKEHQLGAQVGTTALSFINSVVQPSAEPKVFNDTNDGRSALEGGQVDAFVTDVVTTVYLRDFEIKNSVVVGQYPEQEQFGMVFEQGSPLVGCVNEVLAEMKSDGTIDKLQDKWLKQYLSVPDLQ